MVNPYYVPRAPKPCPTCNQHFDKAKPQEVYCSMECAILPRIKRGGEDECWPWMGGLVMGYGAGTFQKRRYRVSRWMLERRLGRQLADGEQALHRCDNPACCNPAHLFVGTAADNMMDKMIKGRCRNKPSDRRGERHHKSKLTEANVRVIWGARHCGKQVELAERFGVTRDVIWKVMKGRSWSYLTKNLP